MRAVFLDFDNHVENDLVITGDSAHHLNVVRVKNNEEILVLNGKGIALEAVVKSISKHTIELKIAGKLNKSPSHALSLAIASPKKDAFEDIVKMAVELGIKEIYPLKSEYSQYDYAPSERLNRILESALIQSNNYFLPIIHPQQTLESYIAATSEQVYFFNSIEDTHNTTNSVTSSSGGVLLIGPEAGFKNEEIEMIRQSKKAKEIHLPTPILRAPTAFAAGVGHLLARM